jgi:predicted ATPase/class 3 adenylate cyclase
VDDQIQQPPQGVVTLMFTDVEGSTAKWESYPGKFGEALQIHDRIMREAIARHNGYVVKTVGDAFMVAFSDPAAASLCAAEVQGILAEAATKHAVFEEVGSIRVRIGVHTGQPTFRENDYFGPAVNRAARICDAGHGGMTLLSAETVRRATEEALAPYRLEDCGPHKLKDFGDPERLYLLLRPGEAAPSNLQLRTLNRVPNNFPAQVTSFVGRKTEVKNLMEVLRKRQSRLITLTGPGGTGKTRLAMQVAVDRLQDYPDGVWLVELAGLSEASMVPSTIALALGIELKPGVEPLQQVVEFLRPLQCLLVLDNFEHVSEAGRAVGALLKDCPTLTCMVTSREVLHVYGEREFVVEPLSVPAAVLETDEWMQYESVQLFAERCQTARPDFVLSPETGPIVSEICRRLDGIPLAIELAAARIRGMSPGQILQRLTSRLHLLSSTQRDLPERQRTLRSAIDWSYDFLSEDEKSLFAEFGVFNAGCFMEAAEEICQTPGAFDLLFSLRDKSLVHTDEVNGETRYRMLETLREYATEKLHDAGSLGRVRDRHADYYLRLAEQWQERLAGAGSESSEATHVFMTEIDNMRAGMDWVIEKGDSGKIVSYGKALFGFLRRRGLYGECDSRLGRAVKAAREADDRRSLARLLNQLGLSAWERSDFSVAHPLFEESYQISKELGDKTRMLVTLINLGNIDWGRSEFAKARRAWEEALELAVETNQERYEAYIRDDLGILACQVGDFQTAAQQCEQSIALHRKLNNQEGVAFSLYNSSEVLRRTGQYERALERVQRAQRIFQALGHERGAALTAIRIGMVMLEQGRPKEGIPHVEAGLRTARETGDRQGQSYGLDVMARILSVHGDRAKATDLFRQSFALANRIGDKKHVADLLRHYAEMLESHEETETAYQALVMASREYKALGLMDAAELDQKLAFLAARLGPDRAPILADIASRSNPMVILQPGTGPLVIR